MAQKFKRVLSAASFTGIATANVTCQPNQYNKVGTLTVPAQQAIAWGATDVINGGATGRQVYISLYDSSAGGAVLNGVVRLSVANATETSEEVVLEERTERLAAGSGYDRTISVLLPEDFRYAKQDSKLIIKFYPDSSTAVTIGYAATSTKISIPVTVLQ